MKIRAIVALLPSLILVACNPAVTQPSEETEQPQPTATTQAPAVAPAPERSEAVAPAKDEVTTNHYILLSEPWKKYFRGSPKLLIVDTPSKGILELLHQEQSLIKTVLDSSGTATESSDYAELEERLNELKTIIPAAETASGYVATNTKSYGNSNNYISGDTIYMRSHRDSGYYDGYQYRTFREKHKSSSPELVRSVQGLIHNASLDSSDLDQRIEALQRMISLWNRRTSEMNAGGTSGIMRDANEAYLAGLRDFTKIIIALRTDVKNAEAEQTRITHNKSKILEQWKVFEENRLSILHDFLQSNAQATIEPSADDTFATPTLQSGEKCIMVCTIGQRELYFEVSPDRHKQHPFVLVDVTPQP